MNTEQKQEKKNRTRWLFRHISTRLLVSYLLILIVPAAFFGLGLTHFLRDVYMKGEEQNSQQAAMTLAENMKNTFSGVHRVLNHFCANGEIWGYFNHMYQYPENSIKEYYTLVRPAMDSYKALNEEIQAVTMYTRNRSVVTNHSEIQLIQDVPPIRELYEAMLRQDILWTVQEVTLNGKEQLIAARVFRSYGKPGGLFCIELNRDKLRQLLGETDEEISWSVVQPGGEVILSTLGEEDAQALGRWLTEERGGETATSMERTVESGRQHVFTVTFTLPENRGEWRIVETVAANRLDQLVSANVRLFAAAGAFLIILMALLSYVFAHNMGRQLGTYRRGIAQIEQGNFSVEIPVKGADEIADLGRALNHMTRRLDTLIQENTTMAVRQQQLEVASREASLHALQSQINPHFLYNSLEAIRYGIAQGDRETGHIVQLLARSLRRMASWEEQTVALRDELQCIDEYLQIQKFRFGERLEYRMDIEAGLEEMQLPKLILQPLVENAVSHGIARKKDGGTVWIGGAREGDKVVFTVEDNGAGMDEFAQEELRQILARPDAKSGSIGLKNVYERIRLYYGERAKLTWDSREGEYTRFCLMIEPEGGSVCGF